MRSTPEGSASSASVYSSPADVASWRMSMGNKIDKYLDAAVAGVLGLESNSIPLDESFVDLGGNHRDARELRAACMESGLAVKTKDIINSKTIAELKTHIAPLTPPEADVPPSTISPLELASSEYPLLDLIDDKPEPDQPPAIPPKAPARYSVAQLKLKSRPSRRIQVEQALSLHGDVSRACVLKPKAGPFEGQLVAFVTLASYAAHQSNDCEVKLRDGYHNNQLSTIRKAVESRIPPSLVPSVWVILEGMPIDDAGKTHRRKLQTWIQNVNDELYRRIQSIDSEENLAQPTSITERRLQRAASRVLHVEQARIGMNKSFASLGGDYNTAKQFASKCESQGILVSAEDVMQTESLARLATRTMSTKLQPRNQSETTTETFELSPMQRLYFSTPMGNGSELRKARDGEYRFNQSMLFRLKRSMSAEDVRAAIEAIVGHHPMLRCRFRPQGNSWRQSIEPDISSSYHFSHHSVTTDAEVEEVIKTAQAGIDIEKGPIFAVRHFYTHDGIQMLYMVAHHLVIDLRSWRIIADDLEGLLNSGYLASGSNGLSFKDWTLHLRHRIQGMEIHSDIPEGHSQYWGIGAASNTYGNTVVSGFALDAETTSTIQASCRALKTHPSDVYMAALLLSFIRTFRDRPVPTLWYQENDRVAPSTKHDVSGTVGWFTSLCSLMVDIPPEDDILSVLRRFKASPRGPKSIAQFARGLIDDDSAPSFAAQCPLELMFTYAETMQMVRSQDALLEQLPVPGGTLASGTSDIGCDVGRIAMFEVSVFLDRDETKLKFLYNRNAMHKERIQSWISSYEEILHQATADLRDEAPELSLSDSPRTDFLTEELGALNQGHLNLNISNIEAAYPVTTIQQTILTNQSLIPGSSNVQMIYDLDTSDGPVDISRICSAWLQVTEKQPALRTVFSQSVSKDRLYDRIVLRSHSPNMLFLESDSVEDAMASIDNLPPLLLNEGTPWHRLVVCRVAGKTFLKLEASQAVLDTVSMTLLFRQLEKIYFSNDSPHVSQMCYTEYTKCLKTTTHSLEFWKEHLRGIQPCQFPMLTSKRPTSNDWDTSSVDLGISSEKLKAFANEYKVNLSSVLSVAWGLLLRTYVGTNNVCFGFRISGRDLPVEGISDAIGSFSTVLASRLATNPSESIAQLLLTAEEDHRHVLEHQHVPMTRIEHELKVKGNRLFNTCLSLGYEYVSDDASSSSKCRHVRTEQASEYDINTDVYFHDGNVTVDVGYRILTPNQATTIAYAFGRAIETILDAPTSMVKETDLFSTRDHEQILAWNSMPQVDVSKENVHQLISEQASLNPEIQAISAWDGDLSYGELHRLSTTLAKHLLASGLKPQTPVPVIVDKSLWAVVAMLAVLHAGAILVPIDAEVNSSFTCVIKAVGANFALVSDHVRESIGDIDVKITVVNDRSILAMSSQAMDITLPRPQLHEIACILFGSGSLNPKGISYSHGALATACSGQASTLLINPSSRVMQLSSYSVDIALSEIFSTLVNGGCVCVPSTSERIADFSGAARRMRVNWTYLTPALSRKLDPESLPDISVVCFRIRRLEEDVYAPWVGKAKVLLTYGSAEACPFGLSATEITSSNQPLCFGTPFSGNFWIVSPEDNNRLVPVGALGELVIGGPTLASGFDIKGPDVRALVGKSSARAKTLLEKSGSRLLKTGHYARYRGEGRIEFNSDDSEQTEIDGRSFRLSDIESKLRQGLGRSVGVVVETIAFNDTKSTPILAAFVELGESLLKDNQDLSRLSRIARERLYLFKKMADLALRESLPSFMVPSAYIPVKSLPLTPALDVDRLELQRMISGLSREKLIRLAEVPNPQEVQDVSFKPLPLTDVEHRMRTIWAQVLGIEQISITANDGFLSLGGDVILAHDLIIKCRQQGLGISIIDVLRNISLTELCRGVFTTEVSPAATRQVEVSEASPTDTSSVSEALAPRLGSNKSLIEDIAEASFLQAIFVESGMLQSCNDLTYLTININGHLEWHQLEKACLMLTKSHPILRTAFASHNRQLYQTVLRSYHPEFLRYQCQGWRLGSFTTKLIKREQSLPLDFRQPITKFSYIDAGKSSTLVIRLSRAQYDELSLRILIQDLSRLYSCTDQVIQRPGFCEVVRAAQSTHLDGSIEHWRNLLADATITEIIPQPSPTSINRDMMTIHRQIPTGSLQNLGIPFETILKGAWSVILSNLSGHDDVVFGELVQSNNLSLPNGQSISDVVGPIGNIIPVRTRLPDMPITPYEYFRCMQSQHVASVPHENLQTSDIVQKCTPWPSWTRFSTLVQHQNQNEDNGLIDFTIGGATCKVNSIEPNNHGSDILVKSVIMGCTNVDISLTFSENRVPSTFADDILKMLCSVISLLTSSFVMEPIILKGLGDNYSASRIPLPSPKRERDVPSTVESVDPDQAHAVHTMISTAWNTILEADSLKVPDIRSVPFYEIWGALIPAAELARYYTENIPSAPGVEWVTFTMEEIIDYPTMMQQYELIIAKLHPAQLKRNKSLMPMRKQSVWSKGLLRLGGTAHPTNATPNKHPTHRHHKSLGSETSMESMTMGSSQSEDDELKGDVIPFGANAPGMLKLAATTNNTKLTKKGSTLFGRKRPAIAG
ncbi:hypothetical protein M426DRAFT_69458 [Hypoxylon sp. CI-4A]|nr:hypothetical protein M426DRAFT_69458 [Hypoxylon sp. CI-4A]